MEELANRVRTKIYMDMSNATSLEVSTIRLVMVHLVFERELQLLSMYCKMAQST